MDDQLVRLWWSKKYMTKGSRSTKIKKEVGHQAGSKKIGLESSSVVSGPEAGAYHNELSILELSGYEELLDSSNFW